MNHLDELLNESFKRDVAEREEREARKAAMKDPFKKARTEPDVHGRVTDSTATRVERTAMWVTSGANCCDHGTAPEQQRTEAACLT